MVRPLPGRVLVRPAPPPKRSTVLELVETPPAPTSGQVVALGHRKLCEHCGAMRPATITIGDVVLFPPTAGQDVRLAGTDYVLLDEDDVLAVVPHAPTVEGIPV